MAIHPSATSTPKAWKRTWISTENLLPPTVSFPTSTPLAAGRRIGSHDGHFCPPSPSYRPISRCATSSYDCKSLHNELSLRPASSARSMSSSSLDLKIGNSVNLIKFMLCTEINNISAHFLSLSFFFC